MALYRRKIFSFKEVQEAINMYYKSPATILRRFNIQR